MKTTKIEWEKPEIIVELPIRETLAQKNTTGPDAGPNNPTPAGKS